VLVVTQVKEIMINQDLQNKLLSAGYKGKFELSELIEACGKIGVKISYSEDGRIYAKFDIYDEHGNLIDFWMNSLEEIYANLWLALNKK